MPPGLGFAPPPPPSPPPPPPLEWDPFCAAALAGGGWPFAPMPTKLGANFLAPFGKRLAASALRAPGEPLSSLSRYEWMGNKKEVFFLFLFGDLFDRFGDFCYTCSQAEAGFSLSLFRGFLLVCSELTFFFSPCGCLICVLFLTFFSYYLNNKP